ncbi:MAG: sulfite exporter TauE/SafE family protein, partial [Saprospiraceae bacterium]|nr:sulfite exporter TauE/SafE family protein [Saprospiraceae bacterium]
SKFYIVLTVIGAIAGVLVATWVSNEQFKTVFSYMMIVMLFVVLIKPKRWLRETDLSSTPRLWLTIPAFLFLGFYGGFIQMGMGIIFLAIMVLGVKWSLIDSNVIKSFIVVVYTVFVIAIFQWKGLIDWQIGAILAIGQTAGGWFTAQFASRYEKANLWAYRLLVVVMILAVIKLFNLHTYFLN